MVSKFLFILVLLVLVSGCIQQPDKKTADEIINTEKNNLESPENKILKDDESTKFIDGIRTESSDRLSLKSLGISIESWDRKTNFAGDLIFSKNLLFDDGRVSNDKVFIDFGSKDKYRPNGIGSIEYWFYVPLGTSIISPIDGRVEIIFFEHTQDWGINIKHSDSDIIVSFEHVVNVFVSNGDLVKAGDVLAEAAPRGTFNSQIAMTELAVWKGGKEIIKYCPFIFLDEALKPVYKEKIEKLSSDWEEFVGKDIYKQENWIFPGCLVESIVER